MSLEFLTIFRFFLPLCMFTKKFRSLIHHSCRSTKKFPLLSHTLLSFLWYISRILLLHSLLHLKYGAYYRAYKTCFKIHYKGRKVFHKIFNSSYSNSNTKLWKKFLEQFNRTSTLTQLTRKNLSAEKINQIKPQKWLEKFWNCV
jgi:hypothetical protein